MLKREAHRIALVEAASGGSPKFFLGTDSAPHPAHLKEHAAGCAGCYTAHAAIELYAEAFDNADALDIIARQNLREPNTELMLKPVLPKLLLARVRALLDAACQNRT